MHKKYYILLFFLIFLNFTYAQQIIKSISTSENIPFVEIYSDKGDLIGLSDENGVVTPELNKKIYLLDSKTITFSHFSFEKRVVPIDNYKTLPFLMLNPTSTILKEVIITNNYKKKYLKLKGYFRSSQINQDRVQYFIDGIVEYYISTVSNKVKIKIIYHRTFEDKEIKQLSKRYHFQVAGVPMFNDFFKINNLSKEYNLDTINNKLINIINKNDRTNKGVISNQNNNLTSLQLVLISMDNPKIMKFLGMESHLNNHTVFAVYDTSELTKINLNSITYFKEIREYEIKRKKKDNYTKIDAIHEFFLYDKEYTNDIKTSGFDDFYSFKSDSYYNENYWKNIPNVIYQSLPNSLETAINNNLKENKNTFPKI